MSDADRPEPTDPTVPATTVRQGPDDDVVAAWMAEQRWYAAKGTTPRIRTIGMVEADRDGVAVQTRFVLDDGPAEPVLYQVPLTLRDAPVDDLQHALVASDGDRWLYDGPHDPAYASWLLDTVDGGATVGGRDADLDARSLDTMGGVDASRVLRGEQSNTSVICDVAGGRRVIVKVFRVLHHGDNPDVTTQAALSGGGSERVPRSFGFLHGTWPDAGRPDGTATGHLAFAQEFLPGLEDAWRVALDAARDGTSFAGPAERLGAALAEVHEVLGRTMPVVPAGTAEVEAATASMRQRLDTAASEVQDVARHVDAVRHVYDRASALPWPAMQRIHGDLHLGQVLSAPEPRGWVFLDFEGEPLRPMPERSRPDSPLRDVAGMLRSFDYVAGSLAQETPAVDTGTWAADARAAFVAGYEQGAGVSLADQQALLDAFEIDKAVYEAVYEARNRPTWLSIPVDAVTRLVERSVD